MKFRTQYSDAIRMTHRTCAEEVPMYGVNDSGEVYIKGYTNQQNEIDSYKDGCLLENIIKRYALEPELLVDKGNGFVDVSDVPTDPSKLITQSQFAMNYYLSLSEEDRAKFKDFNDFADKYMILFAKQTDTKTEVSENE